MLVGFSTDASPGAELWINAIEVNAIRAPLPNEFGPQVRCVLFCGVNKFGVCESLDEVRDKLMHWWHTETL